MSNTVLFPKNEVGKNEFSKLATLTRRSCLAMDNDIFRFNGRVLLTHTTKQAGIYCSRCCFDGGSFLCGFVSCAPNERHDGKSAWFTIEPTGKEVSHE